MIKPETVIKEILKPPFHFHIGSDSIHNGNDTAVLIINDLCLTYFPHYERDDARNRILARITSMLNGKTDMDFGEPLRWKIDISDFGDSIECPACEENFIYDSYDYRISDRFNFCPSCGIRLMFSEEEAK